jgi:PqqD family protein of HPr-rel-A system
MSASLSPLKWKTTGRLLWHNWEGECAVYNTASGNTHILDLTSAKILMVLEEQPCDVPKLAGIAAGKLGLEPDPEIADHVEQLIARFHDLDLIEPEAK